MGAKKPTNGSTNQLNSSSKKGLFGSLSSSSFQPNVFPNSVRSNSLAAINQKKIASDLEHQFETAQRMKKNLQRGVKRGIGA